MNLEQDPHGMVKRAAGLAHWKQQRAIEHIRTNISAELRVDDLAAVLHMSRFHFARMFKSSFGIPPHRLVVLLRVERARELLADSDIPIVEVARSVGFKTQAHFTDVFHQLVGLSPRRFRHRIHTQASVRAV